MGRERKRNHSPPTPTPTPTPISISISISITAADPNLSNSRSAMVPRPVVAVILLFPIEGETGELANQEAHKEAGGQGSGSVFYVKQKIGNACGTIALLHAMANNRDLATFQVSCPTLVPPPRFENRPR